MGIGGGASDTDPPRDQRATRQTDAARELAALMVKELGVAIDPKAFKHFLLENWSLVSQLAHRVHDGKG